jgi:hypothetical protein
MSTSETKEIDGKKYVQVPDWHSEASLHLINQAYLEQLPPSELIWTIETALIILKKKAVKFELST